MKRVFFDCLTSNNQLQAGGEISSNSHCNEGVVSEISKVWIFHLENVLAIFIDCDIVFVPVHNIRVASDLFIVWIVQVEGRHGKSGVFDEELSLLFALLRSDYGIGWMQFDHRLRYKFHDLGGRVRVVVKVHDGAFVFSRIPSFNAVVNCQV